MNISQNRNRASICRRRRSGAKTPSTTRRRATAWPRRGWSPSCMRKKLRRRRMRASPNRQKNRGWTWPRTDQLGVWAVWRRPWGVTGRPPAPDGPPPGAGCPTATQAAEDVETTAVGGPQRALPRPQRAPPRPLGAKRRPPLQRERRGRPFWAFDADPAHTRSYSLRTYILFFYFLL